ncbi:MAG: glycosyltransferase family 2 protein [Caldilineaceae bacterium]|nr:glycosyltransferase family 2 protein [Caldilineaceae bacterium]
MDLSIIIPCYNEVQNINKIHTELLPIVRHMQTQGATGSVATAAIEVIFVDDGSDDGTFFALLDAFGDLEVEGITFEFSQHRVNQGLGAALRTGFDVAKGAVIVTTDADGTYRFEDIPRLVARLTADVDMVTASPYHPDGAVEGVPAYRLLLSRGSSAIYRILADRRVYTYTALFRAYRSSLIRNVPFHSTGFLAGTELLVNAIRMGYRVAEFPTVLYARAFGASKAKIARTVQAHVGFQLNSLLPWHPYGFIIRGSESTLYLCDNGQKRPFPTPEIFLSHGYHWQQVVQISDQELAELTDGTPMTFRDGTLLCGGDDTVYIAEAGCKRPFVTAADFESLGYRWENIVQVPDEQLDDLETGAPVLATERHPNGTLLQGSSDTVYLLKNGKRCAITSIQVFQSWGFAWEQIVNVADSTLVRYPLGETVQPQKSMFHNWRSLQAQTYSFVNQPLPANFAA